MPANDPELERLKRLRERQLIDRDPLVKQRQFQRASAGRSNVLVSPWAIPSSAAAIVIFALFGIILGRAIDKRENIKKLMQ